MRPPTDFPSEPARSQDLEWQRFLVPAAEQVWFVTFFTLATIVGWLVAGVASATIQQNWVMVLPDAVPLQMILAQPGLKPLEIGLWTGAIVGVTQWLILRAYIPTLTWVSATCIGWGLSTMVALGWSNWVSPLMATAAFIWLGAIQWFVLRRFVRDAGWWVLIPVLPSVLVVGLFQIMTLGVRSIGVEVATSPVWQFILFSLPEIIRILGLGLLQAAGFCTLRRQQGTITVPIRQKSPLVAAPRITDTQQVYRLSQILYDTIDRHWQSEVTCDQDLIYLVGVTEQGEIATYRPVNQAAIDHDHETPLARLIELENYSTGQRRFNLPLARFRVVFTPTGVLKVNPW
ncbi:MAG: hypothetical protein KME16_11745 [Scytolyngbya sp. HA4215-MV1]|jgi:hypothetical protein|nr:hypothetical protein [Scytolyngbya sp. HA4215-MV1]